MDTIVNKLPLTYTDLQRNYSCLFYLVTAIYTTEGQSILEVQSSVYILPLCFYFLCQIVYLRHIFDIVISYATVHIVVSYDMLILEK